MGAVLCFKKVAIEDLEQFRAGDPLALFWRRGESGRATVTDLDQSWDGLQYLLNAVGSGVELIDGEDLPAEGMLALSAELVHATAERLGALPFDTLASHYAPPDMSDEGINPGIWENEAEDGLSYLRENYARLVAFFHEAAESGAAVVMHLG